MARRTHNNNFTIGGIPIVTTEWIPPNEIMIVVPEQKVTITYHEGPSAGQTMEIIVRKLQVVQTVNIEAE